MFSLVYSFMNETAKTKLTAELKGKIEKEWFGLPMAIRQRYWEETDYGKNADFLSPGLLQQMIKKPRKIRE